MLILATEAFLQLYIVELHFRKSLILCITYPLAIYFSILPFILFIFLKKGKVTSIFLFPSFYLNYTRQHLSIWTDPFAMATPRSLAIFPNMNSLCLSFCMLVRLTGLQNVWFLFIYLSKDMKEKIPVYTNIQIISRCSIVFFSQNIRISLLHKCYTNSINSQYLS